MVVAAVLAWVFWPDPVPESRAREYRDVTACLLTGAAGVDEPEAAPVWAGMQEASLTTAAKVQFLEVDGPQTAENAEGYLASLIQSRCDLVLAVGDAPTTALAARAGQYPDDRFVLIGAGQGGPNVSVVESDESEQIRVTVRNLVADAVGDPAAD
jgi:DNA-binding LacI/PurR family transcriptional regulator